MKPGASRSFGGQLKSLREAAGFTQEELATIAGLSVHAVSALERGERRRPQFETVRALAAALDLTGGGRDALLASARAAAPAASVDDLGSSLLPLALTTLLGRESDLDTLRSWLSDPAVRLITLTGPGGVGKTRLALEIARAIAADGTTRVVFTPLAAVPAPSFVAPAIAEALGVLESSAHDLPRRVRLACDGTPTLLLIDNFEQVVEAAPLVADLLGAAPALRVLVTSRAPLRIRGEREYAVGPLPLQADADPTIPADLSRCPAVQLFLDRVRDVHPRFRLTPANGPTVAAICRRLDALPLAIELAAPWMKTLTAEDLLRQLARDVLLSPIGPSDLPERQRTMNAAIAWSYQLLGVDEQRVFRRLGALPGRFSVEAAAAVLAGGGSPATNDEALRAAAGLIDKSLLLRAEAPAAPRPLYQMLETVRAYAALELEAAGEREDALAGLARYCTLEASLAATGLFGAAQAQWLDRVRDDLESYRGALTWLIERGRGVEAADIAWGLMYFWVIRGHSSEGLQWYQRILDLPSLPAIPESKALVGAAMMWYSLGDVENARRHLTRALALARAAGSTEMIAQAEHLSGHVEHGVGNTTAARAHFANSIEGFRALGIPWGEGNSLNGLAKVALAVDDTSAAEQLLDQATAVMRDSGAPFFLALVSFRRATLAVKRGNPDDAIAWVRHSLNLFRQLHDKYAIVYALVPLAAAAVLKGDDLWTARILGARDAVTERTGAMVVDQWVHALGEQAESAVRARLGPDRWARAYAAGRNTSIDSLMRDIDGVPRSPVHT